MSNEQREEKIREEADVTEGEDGVWVATYGNNNGFPYEGRGLTAYSAVDSLINRIMFGDDDSCLI